MSPHGWHLKFLIILLLSFYVLCKYPIMQAVVLFDDLQRLKWFYRKNSNCTGVHLALL